ncbi:S1C family serine protease [Geochorda subterranea]|uniref:Trypsin-like peptidase domain-containing protein n=1 Tax=Geochorda subterranea TaxID=3109564 RepID=A0ABZ1BP37_9FIRM|nr:trypsin-like peptidase domain-containing protein [Limnochorda sp. LNt]WRP14363.1 trypsin-like peptidase domain-containing protein [Limnochorda sp. LNt]
MPGMPRRRTLPVAISLVAVVAGAWGLAATMAPPLQALQPSEQALVELYQRVAPAVVRLSRGEGVGSGFVYDAQGHIVTNRHVVAGARTVDVTFLDGTVMTGQVVGTDPDSDLAVVRVERLPAGVEPLVLGDSTAVQVGQTAIAIGNPFGLSGTMTVGIVSGLHRTIPAQARRSAGFVIPDVIQTDAAINPGNSGGPLLDSSGAVIGVATAIALGSPFPAFAGVGLAVPAHLVERVVPSLIAHGSYQWPWLGVSGVGLTPELARANGLPPETRGAYVVQVVPGGPAAAAGLRGSTRPTGAERLPEGGDVIVGIDGSPIASFDDLLVYIARYTSVGQRLQVTVLREGQRLDVPVTLTARPATLPEMP